MSLEFSPPGEDHDRARGYRQSQVSAIMSAPKFIKIDSQRVLWRDIVQLRREQRRHAVLPEQRALFELREDRGRGTERTAAGRYVEPSLFTLVGQ
jgi:hypothetical protein